MDATYDAGDHWRQDATDASGHRTSTDADTSVGGGKYLRRVNVDDGEAAGAPELANQGQH